MPDLLHKIQSCLDFEDLLDLGGMITLYTIFTTQADETSRVHMFRLSFTNIGISSRQLVLQRSGDHYCTLLYI